MLDGVTATLRGGHVAGETDGGGIFRRHGVDRGSRQGLFNGGSVGIGGLVRGELAERGRGRGCGLGVVLASKGGEQGQSGKSGDGTSEFHDDLPVSLI